MPLLLFVASVCCWMQKARGRRKREEGGSRFDTCRNIALFFFLAVWRNTRPAVVFNFYFFMSLQLDCKQFYNLFIPLFIFAFFLNVKVKCSREKQNKISICIYLFIHRLKCIDEKKIVAKSKTPFNAFLIMKTHFIMRFSSFTLVVILYDFKL